MRVFLANHFFKWSLEPNLTKPVHITMVFGEKKIWKKKADHFAKKNFELILKLEVLHKFVWRHFYCITFTQILNFFFLNWKKNACAKKFAKLLTNISTWFNSSSRLAWSNQQTPQFMLFSVLFSQFLFYFVRSRRKSLINYLYIKIFLWPIF